MKDLKIIHIDKAFLVTLKDLEEILSKIKGEKGRVFSIHKVDETHVTIYTKDESAVPNEFAFAFPVVETLVSLVSGGEDPLVCIHPLTAQQVKKGLYLNTQGELLGDYLEDFESFWTPLTQALEKAYKETEP